MAITVQETLDTHTPVWNDNWYIVSSNNSSNSNFRYVFDLYVSGVTTPSYYRFRVDVDPTDGYGYFNPTEILRDYVNSDIVAMNDNIGNFYYTGSNQNVYVGFILKTGEEYGDSSGVTVYPDLATSGNKYAWNGVWSMRDLYATSGVVDYDIYNYAGGQYAHADWRGMTVVPNNGLKVRSDERGFMLFQQTDIYGISTLYITQYDSSGSNIGNITLPLPNAAKNPETTPDNRFIFYAIKPQSLSDAGYALDANCVKYTAQIQSTSYEYGYTYTFYIDDSCGKGDLTQIVWRNRWGGMENFSFITNRKESAKISRNSYRRFVKPTLNGLPNSYTGNKVSDNYEPVYELAIEDGFSLSSGFVSDDYNSFFEDLISSTEIYIYADWTSSGNNYMIPIKCLNTDMRKKRNKESGLVEYEFQFAYTNKRIRQRG